MVNVFAWCVRAMVDEYPEIHGSAVKGDESWRDRIPTMAVMVNLKICMLGTGY